MVLDKEYKNKLFIFFQVWTQTIVLVKNKYIDIIIILVLVLISLSFSR